MRLKYAITSDIEDISKKMKFHLELYKEKVSLDKKLSLIVDDLDSGTAERTLEDIEHMRLEMGKLDLLLNEVAGVLSAASSAYEEAEPAVSPEQPVSSVAKQPEERQQPEPVVSDKAAALQAAMSQLTNITSTLTDMKKQ